MQTFEDSVLDRQDFEQIREMAYRFCGLNLLPGKEELVKARLGKKLKQLGLSTYREYCDHVIRDSTGKTKAAMIDALTTHHTHFFREPQHFVLLRELLRQGVPPPNGEWRIWSSACSTGEEPYSIVISALQELSGHGSGSQLPGAEMKDRSVARGALRGDVKLLATDVSSHSVETASRGRYMEERFRGLPLAELKPYLLRGEGEATGWYLMRPEVRQRIQFQCVNLMEIPSGTECFHVIFCRNVMIYFDLETQARVVAGLAAHLEPGGYLLIGHAESLNAFEHGLEYVRPAVYRRPLSGVSRGRRGVPGTGAGTELS